MSQGALLEVFFFAACSRYSTMTFPLPASDAPDKRVFGLSLLGVVLMGRKGLEIVFSTKDAGRILSSCFLEDE